MSQRRTSYARGAQVTPEADKLRQRRTGPTRAWISYADPIRIGLVQVPFFASQKGED